MLVFFDIPCRYAGRAWSPNTWRVRYSLNYKKIPFRTEWVEFPDIESLCRAKGVPPSRVTPSGREAYTLPAIYDSSYQMGTGIYVSDSAKIMKYLDWRYPQTPKAFPEGTQALQAAFLSAFVGRVLSGTPIWEIMVPGVVDMLNSGADGVGSRGSREFFTESREKTFGKSVKSMRELYGRGAPGREGAWLRVKEGFGSVDRWLSINDLVGGEGDSWDRPSDGTGHLGTSDSESPFLMGVKPVFADFVIGGVLAWIRNVWGEDSEEWHFVAGWHGGRWKRFVGALQ
ncbi:hypothetical protein FA15DRAFT_558791, partial [Coprinopsis marcescibilis]